MHRILVTFALAATATFASAQTGRSYETAEERDQRAVSVDTGAADFYNELVGKTFWYRPGQGYTSYKIHLKAAPDRHNVLRYSDESFPKNLTSFQIVESLVLGKSRDGQYDIYTYRVKLEDGTMAYMDAAAFGIYTGIKRQHIIDYSLLINPSTMARHLDSDIYKYAYVFTEDPRAILERDERQRREKLEAEERERLARKAEATKLEEELAALAKAKAKKGGVRLGMTKKQVLASSWARPEEVNRTISAGGTLEQWVYPGAYLYFQNGKLVTIQD